MEATIISISIATSPAKVYAFASNPANLPTWVPSLCKSIECVDGDWVVQTPDGPAVFAFAAVNEFGVLDHTVTLANGAHFCNPMRVVANGAGSELMFTLFQHEGMANEQFAQDAAIVRSDLETLKQILESEEQKTRRSHGPDPLNKHPMAGFPQVCYLKSIISNPNIIVGDYSYYDDPEDSEGFERNVLYHHPFIGDRLVIGKFCALARGVKFIMNGANHKLSGISTYPFAIFGNGWEKVIPQPGDLPYKGDTVLGNDVWIGYDALIMPGVKIGNGAIVSSRSVVVADVPAYTVVGGNPAKPIKERFPAHIVATLEAIAWWNWPIEKITQHLAHIVAADIEALKACEGSYS